VELFSHNDTLKDKHRVVRNISLLSFTAWLWKPRESCCGV